MFRGYYSFICDNFFTHSLSLSWPIASPPPEAHKSIVRSIFNASGWEIVLLEPATYSTHNVKVFSTGDIYEIPCEK